MLFLGFMHIGLLKELWEFDTCPRIISGSSTGSVMAAGFCTKVGDDLQEFFNVKEGGSIDYHPFQNESNIHYNNIQLWLERIWRICTQHALCDNQILNENIRRNIGDMTFLVFIHHISFHILILRRLIKRRIGY